MDKYIQLYNNVLSKDSCNMLIKQFKYNSNKNELFDDKFKKFSQYALNDDVLRKHIFELLNNLYQQYIKDCQLYPYQYPEKYGFENPRIKKYYDSSCSFKSHVDALNLESSKRYLSFLFYLNADFDKGETVFYFKDEIITIKPKKGSVFMFPPLWTYPHKGNNPENGVKYIMSTYVNFI